MAKAKPKTKSHPFDASMKGMGSEHPADLVTVFDGKPSGEVRLFTPDLSTVTAGADLVVGIGRPLTEIVHIDFQAGPNADKHKDTLAYNALLFREYGVPVHSILVLLRESAMHTNMTGEIKYATRLGRGKMDFAYQVVHLWEWSSQELLEGPLGAAPLAVLAELPEGVPEATALKNIVQRLIARVENETTPEKAVRLLKSAYVLSGLRVDLDSANQLFQGAFSMRESVTWVALQEERELGHAEGKAEGMRDMILGLVQDKQWKLSAANRKKFEAITDVDRLKRMGKHVGKATSWADLLAVV